MIVAVLALFGAACGADVSVDAATTNATADSSADASAAPAPTPAAEPAQAATTGDVLTISFLSGDEFDIGGECSPGGAGFSGLNGESIVSYDGTDALSVDVAFTDPDGSAWTAVNADSSAVGNAGFLVYATMSDGAGTTSDAYVEAICS